MTAVTEWSVLIKVARKQDAAGISRSDLDRLVAILPGTDKGYTGDDGPDATISFWVDASDASSAVQEGWKHIESARDALGMEPWTPIRTHAASAAQRLTGFAGIEARADDPRAWSVLVKAVRTGGDDGLDPAARSRLGDALGADATVAGDASTIVARFWVSANGAGAADAAARSMLDEAIDRLGIPGEWRIVRAHHAVAHERAEETYRGAVERAARSVK